MTPVIADSFRPGFKDHPFFFPKKKVRSSAKKKGDDCRCEIPGGPGYFFLRSALTCAKSRLKRFESGFA